MKKVDLKSKFSLGSEVLQSLFENGKNPLSDQFIRWKIWARWEEIAGPTVGKNSEPVGYSRGVLYLWVPHSPWMQQMTFLKEQIKTTVNTKMGRPYVTEVKLTLDRRSVPVNVQEQNEFKKIVATLSTPKRGES